MKHKGKLTATSILAAAVIVAASFGATPQQPPPPANWLGMQFVKIEPGTFQMGCSPDDTECDDNEKPIHTVRITRAFELGKYEVTLKEWNAAMGESRCAREGPNHPACVTWNEAQRFVTKMNERQDGYRYRLPTEAEWEYAARAGTSSRHGGAANLSDAASFYAPRGTSWARTPVGQKKPNAWGLYDTLGNVNEWVQDWYDDYSPDAATDPKGPTTGSQKVQRGGDYNTFAAGVRVSARTPSPTSLMSTATGFRLAREAVK
jgi:formylglycine-generating enzyme required for sulfatase activity